MLFAVNPAPLIYVGVNPKYCQVGAIETAHGMYAGVGELVCLCASKESKTCGSSEA